MRLISIAAVLIIVVSAPGFAATFGGTVINDAGEPIEGVNVLTNINTLLTITDKDGRFTLVTDGEKPAYLTFSHVSYQPEMIRVAADKDMTDLKIILQPTVYPGQNIRVTAMRAEQRKTPVAYSDFTADDIYRDYTLDEFPVLLDKTPNLYSFTYTGGITGASEFSIRGFNSKRIGVYVNGIPLNDPEDQTTYFYDIPDFADEVSDIQVQRGVGNSAYGDATFGGSINIASAGLERKRKIGFTTGYGRFTADNKLTNEMRKQAIEYSSGLVDGRWSFAARYSNLYSGGYREYAWYDGWAYFISISRLDPKMTTTFNTYGGPLKAHLAYYGISRQTMAIDRRLNWSSYKNEIDDYSQPHYELHNTYRLSKRMTLDNTLYYIKGNGYYEGYKSDKGYYEYNIPDNMIIDTSIHEIDLVRRKWAPKNQYGWNPRLDWVHNKGTASIGGAFYYFNSEHYGEIVWAENVELQPLYRYYEYSGKKYSASVYLIENYSLNDKIRLMGNLQLRYLNYKFDQTKMGVYEGYKYTLGWLFFSPRFGITYLLNDRADIYFSFGVASREPDDATIYDADYPYAKPAIDNNGNLLADAERVYDFELGGNHRGDNHKLGINLFWMEFRNEIVTAIGLDEVGRPLLDNAHRSFHSGIEMNGSIQILKYFNFSANASYNYNRIKDFILYSDNDWNGIIDDTADYSGNPTAGFPEYLGNLIVDFVKAPFRLTYSLRLAGKQYIENGKNEDFAVGSYMVSSLSASISLGRMEGYGRFTLNGRIDNLFNKKYELFGVVDEGVAYYIPAAERSFYAQLKWEIK